MLNILYPLLGAAIATAGGDKLSGDKAYRSMFRHLGWTRSDMDALALAELAGGVLMVPRSTRRLGGALAALASTVILASEVRHSAARLALPRGLVLFAALSACLRPGRA